MLVNNGYSNRLFDSVVNIMLNSALTDEQATTSQNNDIHLFYRNSLTPACKQDEKAIKDILNKNVTTTDPTKSLKLKIYYNSPKTSQLVMKNNHSKQHSPLKQTNVVYQFQCKTGDCATRKVCYIGLTTTTLSRRLTMHLQAGSPKQHMQEHHNMNITRQMMTENTTILTQCNDHRRLQTLETLYIRDTSPIINIHTKQLTQLPLYDRNVI